MTEPTPMDLLLADREVPSLDGEYTMVKVAQVSIQYGEYPDDYKIKYYANPDDLIKRVAGILYWKPDTYLDWLEICDSNYLLFGGLVTRNEPVV